MGSDMETVPQPTTPLTEGSTYDLLALCQSGIVMFPDNILPLVIFSPSLIEAMRSVIFNLKVFALIPAWPKRSADGEPCMAQYGTTAEIYEYSSSRAAGAGQPEKGFRLKTRMKQRFKVLHTWMDENKYMTSVERDHIIYIVTIRSR